MNAEYWKVSDEQVLEKSGKRIAEWVQILDDFRASKMRTYEVVAHLQNEYNVPRYWALIVSTYYLKK